MQREPQKTWERALLLMRATLLPGWSPTASQRLVWAIRGAIVLGVSVLIASAVDKPLWEWLGLLIVPLVLAIGGYLFNSSQNRVTRSATEQRAQDEALEAYLDQMSQLLLHQDSPLRKSKEGDEVRAVAKSLTFTVLRRLDGERKARVVQFLHEAGLIATRTSQARSQDNPILFLWGADLVEANLMEASLHQADLRGTSLFEAYLVEADLRGAALNWASLREADLREADLSGATGITNEGLERQASYLDGATMPDGQKYEDWLKSKGSEEDG